MYKRQGLDLPGRRRSLIADPANSDPSTRNHRKRAQQLVTVLRDQSNYLACSLVLLKPGQSKEYDARGLLLVTEDQFAKVTIIREQ